MSQIDLSKELLHKDPQNQLTHLEQDLLFLLKKDLKKTILVRLHHIQALPHGVVLEVDHEVDQTLESEHHQDVHRAVLALDQHTPHVLHLEAVVASLEAHEVVTLAVVTEVEVVAEDVDEWVKTSTTQNLYINLTKRL